MDPNACLDRFFQALRDACFPDALDARSDLLGWIRGGGFEPVWPDGWTLQRMREWSEPDPLSLDHLHTCALALDCHAQHCDRQADKLWEQQSSDRDYEWNVYHADQSRRYRAQAADCRGTLGRIRALMEALRVD